MAYKYGVGGTQVDFSLPQFGFAGYPVGGAPALPPVAPGAGALSDLLPAPEQLSPPPEEQYPNVDGALATYKALAPDAAAATFTGGAQLGLPSEMAPQWGGTDFSGLMQPEGLVPAVPLGAQSDPRSGGMMGPGAGMGAPLLTATQMAQDARAQQAINARYPLAGTYDPMAEQLDSAANLRKLESMLPAGGVRPVSGEGGAFEQDESGVIRNVPQPPITAGDESGLQLLARKLGMETGAKIAQEDQGKYASADALIDQALASVIQEYDSNPRIPYSMKEQMKAKALATARDKKLQLREFGIAGRPKYEDVP